MRAISLPSLALTTGFLVLGCGGTDTPTPGGVADSSDGGGAQGGSVGTAATTGSGGTPTAGTRTGGATSTGGATQGSCPTTPLTGGTQHCSSNAQGNVGNGMTWTIWSSGSGGCITPYGSGAAFKATWNNSGDFLARVGLQWDRTRTYDQYGTISADFSFAKTGTGGGYSYIGIYGWSVQPTIEYYIVEDSFNTMPINPGTTTSMGTVTLDGSAYNLYTRPASGASIDGSPNWTQFYSIRQKARQCGHISITGHFDAWKAAGMTLGKMCEAKILAEAGGGSGSVDFYQGTVTAQ